MNRTYLVTGGAGFIGSSLADFLLKKDYKVVVIDNFCNFYDPSIKRNNVKDNLDNPNYKLYEIDLRCKSDVEKVFREKKIDVVIHLAAMAGVRPSIENPILYQEVNCIGTQNLLEVMKEYGVKNLVMASSSSVYGNNKKVPFKETDIVDYAISPYAATKKSNEVMTHVYHKLFNMNVIMLRFFTVYGPWGRPDMSPFIFMDAILRGHTINIYNNGDMIRDFTYIDDIVEAITRAIDHVPSCNLNWNSESPDPGSSSAPYKIYNVGNSKPVKLMDFIYTIEKTIGKEANKVFLPMQPGDVYQTNSDTCKLQNDFSFKPNKTLEQGVTETVRWFREFYKL